MSVATSVFYRRKSFWFVCGLPSICIAIYLIFLATPRYESEALVKVYSATDGMSGSSAGTSLGGQGMPGSYVLKDFIQSWDCLHQLDTKKLRDAWISGDFIDGFGGIASFFSTNDMRLWDYYRKKVSVQVDEVSGTVKVNVQGYEPKFVHQLNEQILGIADNTLKQSGIKAYRADAEMLKDKIALDRHRLSELFKQMAIFQKMHGIADFDTAYASVLSTIDAFQQARLSVVSKGAAAGFLAERSQQFAAVKSQLDAIDSNIAKQHDYVASKLAPIYSEYAGLRSQIQESTALLNLDNQNLLSSQELALRNAYYMDVIEKPVMPTNATEPRIFKWLSITLIVTFVAYLIIK